MESNPSTSVMKAEIIKRIVKEQEGWLRCNCDLDNWQPDTRTGHSWVCRIHKTSMERWKNEGPEDE